MSTADDDTLLALERRLTRLVDARLTALRGQLVDALTTAAPTPGTVVDVFSRDTVDRAVTIALATGSAATVSIITAGYRSGARTATARVTEDLAALNLPAPEPTDNLSMTTIVGAVTAAYAGARLDIVTAVTASLGAAVLSTATLALAVAGIDKAVRRLAVRVKSAASVSVHRGYTDTQLDLYSRIVDTNRHVVVYKRWESKSVGDCPSCRALTGVTIPLDEDFDATATSEPNFTPPHVYLNMAGPPRHPNCRCRLVIDPTPDTASLHHELTQTMPVSYTYLTATQVRLMPTDKFVALTKFLTAAVAKIRKLSQQVHRGR